MTGLWWCTHNVDIKSKTLTVSPVAIDNAHSQSTVPGKLFIKSKWMKLRSNSSISYLYERRNRHPSSAPQNIQSTFPNRAHHTSTAGYPISHSVYWVSHSWLHPRGLYCYKGQSFFPYTFTTTAMSARRAKQDFRAGLQQFGSMVETMVERHLGESSIDPPVVSSC